jgi:hypothetical protein
MSYFDNYNRCSKNDVDRSERMYSGNMAVYAVVHLILLFWGVMLALNSQPPENRVFHIILAMLFSPLYVLSYYVNALVSGPVGRARYIKQ